MNPFTEGALVDSVPLRMEQPGRHELPRPTCAGARTDRIVTAREQRERRR